MVFISKNCIKAVNNSSNKLTSKFGKYKLKTQAHTHTGSHARTHTQKEMKKDIEI